MRVKCAGAYFFCAAAGFIAEFFATSAAQAAYRVIQQMLLRLWRAKRGSL